MPRRVCFGLLVVGALGVVGCGSSASQPTGGDAGAADVGAVDAGQGDDAGSAVDTGAATDTGATGAPDVPAASAALVQARPYGLRVPGAYDGSRAVPLVVVLHGYGAAGLGQSVYFGMTTLADREGFLLAYPDGTVDAAGRRFWRASRACCDFAGTNVDDVAYLNAVLDDIQARYRVDPGRVYLVGHSNGGFMAHRMACAASSRIAAIVSLAGATGVDDDYPCAPTAPVGVLQVHGTQDATVRFNGGILTAGEAARYPGAQATVDRWRMLQQCGAFAEVAPTLDLDNAVAGPETTVTRAAACARGGVELWTLTGSAHIPALSPEFARQAWAFLQRHARNP